MAAVIAAAASADNCGWVKLFDGETLDGWQQNNGTAKYSVEDGCVVGRTNEGSPNSFMCTKKLYGDFELKFEVKVPQLTQLDDCCPKIQVFKDKILLFQSG